MMDMFEQPVNRRGIDTLKWDVPEDVLPMWGADMDFRTAPEITEALKKRAEQGIFGYSIVPDRWYDAYIDWWKMRHDFVMEKEWLIFCTGVVASISSMVRKLTTPGEKVLIQTPVYNIFFHSIRNNGREILESPLIYRNGTYEMNFTDLEEKLSDPQTTLMLLCNPHNPVGRIWSREELSKLGSLCKKYHVTVISDETHCDLTAPECSYVPFASVSEEYRENSITCISPGKAFNLTGVQSAAVVVPEQNLRHKVRWGLNTDEVAEPNAFAVDGAVAAFTEGSQWLDALRSYLWENRRLAEAYLKNEIPEIRAVPAEAACLLWLDCRHLIGTANELAVYLKEKCGLYLSAGSQYGTAGRDFLCINQACPGEQLMEGLRRLKTGVKAYQDMVVSQC